MRALTQLAAIWVVLGLTASAPTSSRPVQVPAPSDLQNSVRAVIAERVGAPMRSGSQTTREEGAELTRLYAPGDFQPLWADVGGRPTGDARESLLMLANAAADGLDPADYDVDRLRALRGAAASCVRPSAADVASLDVDLSRMTLRYLRDLAVGLDPRTVGWRMPAPSPRSDLPDVLRDALSAHRLASAAASVAPAFDQYQKLRRELARYRALAADRSLDAPWVPGKVIHPKDRYPGLGGLVRFLTAVGDVPSGAAPIAGDVYDGPIVDAVKHFQARHALEPDGVIGGLTASALAVPISARVRQLELAMERLRWLSVSTDPRVIVLNIPMFQLWAWSGPDHATLSMKAIVGRAVRTETPMFVEDMEYVIFRPYWNVPPSILRNEILPALARNPNYLSAHDMEIVRGDGDDAVPVAVTAETVSALRAGALRLRQRPGPKNSLGLVKFVFPNNNNVYMHGTPETALFDRARRDFSHGCVRLADPVSLAEWVLSDQPDWTRERILAVMNGTGPQRVDLTRPIRVVLFYTTVLVGPADDEVHFAPDIYGQDVKLDRALRQRR